MNVLDQVAQALQYADEAYAIFNRLKDQVEQAKDDLHPSNLEDARARLAAALQRANQAADSLDAAIAKKLES